MNYRLLTLSILLVTGAAGAQTPPPPPTDAPAPQVPAAQDVPTTSGQVKQYLIAPRGEVDGLLLTDGTQIAVPPHLQTALTASVKPGDAIRIQGNRESASRIVAQQIDDTATGAHVVDRGPDSSPPPPPPADDTTLATLSAKGTVTALLSGPRGEVNGAVLDDGSVIHFAPRTGLYYADQLKIGSSVTVSGMGTQNSFGRGIDVQELRAN